MLAKEILLNPLPNAGETDGSLIYEKVERKPISRE
jgi:hypothetical protein